jgi:hypothetical protein
MPKHFQIVAEYQRQKPVVTCCYNWLSDMGVTRHQQYPYSPQKTGGSQAELHFGLQNGPAAVLAAIGSMTAEERAAILAALGAPEGAVVE